MPTIIEFDPNAMMKYTHTFFEHDKNIVTTFSGK